MTKSKKLDSLIRLSNIATKAPKHINKELIKQKAEELYVQIGKLQHKLYAEKKHSVLVIFQGMDATGKDTATKNVFSHCSPQGIRVEAFKKPTEEEMSHDFLWRIHQNAPSKGFIQIFNRSHYEDILIQRVHHWIDEERVEKRMQAINAFEELLKFDNNTLILKFFMHTSADHQLEELKERLIEPNKNWKHNPSDWEERKFWNQYMEAYEFAINQSTIPWHVIPVDNRWYKDYLIAEIILKALQELNMKLPVLKDPITLEDQLVIKNG